MKSAKLIRAALLALLVTTVPVAALNAQETTTDAATVETHEEGFDWGWLGLLGLLGLLPRKPIEEHVRTSEVNSMRRP